MTNNNNNVIPMPQLAASANNDPYMPPVTPQDNNNFVASGSHNPDEREALRLRGGGFCGGFFGCLCAIITCEICC
ncbi:hypothetical protein H4217_001256 [Coemansia sp. RSA 1939]|nr:hypothetical protein H4217_001256 [Coemansia sp. RSA 1939]